MSFCNEIKRELAEIRPPKRCKLPLVYGFLLFGRSFSYKRIAMQTTSDVMADYYGRLVRDVYGVETVVESGGEKKTTYRAFIPSAGDRLRILASFDFGVYDGEINEEMIEDDTAAAAFIRGAFLSCGRISDPEREYRADFSVRNLSLAKEFQALLERHFITANLAEHGSGYTVYIRKSEMIINLLTLIGLSDRSLATIETTIVKSVKNQMNRARNCDNANIGKTVEASIRQRKAIEYLARTGRLETLPQPLYNAAILRRDHPEVSLHELCRLSPEPISQSGLNHRLQKLIAIYEECRNK